jgi:hypothetical protein
VGILAAKKPDLLGQVQSHKDVAITIGQLPQK